MQPTESLLKDLTDQQRQAVTHTEGPLLIIAGAGSGKTRVLTRRVGYLLSLGIPPSSILAITFTNKAAGEMKQRIGALTDRPLRDLGRLDQPWPMVCTFHSLGLRILRHYAPTIGLPENFTIFDSGDQQKLIKESIKMLDLSSTNFPPASVHGTISNAKNQLLTAEQFAASAGDFYRKTVARVYRKYEQLLQQNNAMDFDDLLLRTAHALRDHPLILRELQERFGYLLIDEYQDTNHAQYIVAHALAQKHRNICVVGDPDQCLPPDTPISTADGSRPIREIRAPDEVLSASGWGCAVPMPVDHAMHKPYRGPLVRIRTEGGETLRATPNHLCFARLRPDAGMHCTYLMWKRGVGYQLGTMRGVRTSKDRKIANGMQVRTNQEVPDKVWIVHASRSSAETRFYEHYYSVRYGIPTMASFVRGRRMDMTREWVDKLYREIDTTDAAERLMDDLGIDRRYPHHRPGAVMRQTTANGPGWARRHVLFTMFDDNRNLKKAPWHEHRVQLVTSGEGLREHAATRFNVRDGSRGTWRIETSRKHYDDGLSLATRICELDNAMEIIPRARLSNGHAFHLMPIGHIHPGMVVPVVEKDEVVERAVESVEREEYHGPVYDLSVPETRNYVAGGIVVHNSIYAWRGADIRNILEFEKDYPDATVVKLEQNYRSTKTILSIASQLIAHNRQRRDKKLWTENVEGAKAELYQCQDEHDEARLVAERFRQLHDEGIEWNKMAVFYRMNALSRVMEDALRKANLPYVMARGVEFYNRKVIKDTLAYLRTIANPSDEISLLRIVNTPARGIGSSTIKQVQTYAVGQGLSLWDAMRQADQVTGISTRGLKSLQQFVALVEEWRRMANTAQGTEEPPESLYDKAEPSTPAAPLRMLLEDVVRRSGMETALRKERKDADSDDDPLANVNELISSVVEFESENPQGSLQDYLSMVSLVSDADHMKDGGGAITLMTLHAAKGLEFPVVAIIGLEEGVLPHSRARTNPEELEEERRLCFVGITRAQQRLILTKAAYRTIRGLRERTVSSPFLAELPIDQLIVTDRTGLAFATDRATEREYLQDESQQLANRFKRGQLVRHRQFGLGRILDISDMGQHTRAVVDFNQAGRKTLILQYAHLEPAG